MPEQTDPRHQYQNPRGSRGHRRAGGSKRGNSRGGYHNFDQSYSHHSPYNTRRGGPNRFTTLICDYCKRPGHHINDCRQRQRQQQNQRSHTNYNFDQYQLQQQQTVGHILRSLLLHTNMPPSCWGHAVTFTMQVKNSLPILSRSISSPYESFFGTPPKLAHLRTFGCKVLFHLHKTDYSKLDARAEQAIYLANTSASIVELLDKTGRIIERRFDDCVFYEDEFPPVPYPASITEPLHITSTPMITPISDTYVLKFQSTRAHITAQPLISILPKSLATRTQNIIPGSSSQPISIPLEVLLLVASTRIPTRINMLRSLALSTAMTQPFLSFFLLPVA